MRTLLILLAFLGAPFARDAHAKFVRSAIWGARPLGMGNAFLAISDDGNAPFYNPAALARISGLHWNLIDIGVGVDSNDTLNRTKNALFNGDLRNFVRSDTQFMQLGAKTTFISKYFALGFFDGFQGFFDIRNLQSLEAQVDIYSANDVGMIAAFGIPAGDNLSLGFSVRAIQRTGVDISITGQELLAQAQATQSGFLDAAYDYVKGLGGLGWGLGLNVGALVDVPLKTKSPRLRLAATVEDVGQTTFKSIGINLLPKPIRPSYHLGSALQYEISKQSQMNIALDLRNNFEALPFTQVLNFGLEFRHRIFGLRLGAHHAYLTYGLSLEFPPHTRLHFTSYSVELGNTVREREQRLYLLQAIIGFNPL